MDQVSGQEAQVHPLCGAKTRTGGKCKTMAMPNGRCRMHGGKNKGAPEGNQNAVGNAGPKTHGIYAKSLTDQELEDLPDIKATIGRLDDEIAMFKIRMQRALRAEAEQNEALISRRFNETVEVEEILEREGNGVPIADREVKFRRVDYHTVINQLAARIESLEKTRKALMADDQGEKPIDGIEIVEYDD